MADLVLYRNRRTGDEYVVIITEGDESEHAKHGYEAVQTVELPSNVDLYKFPTDRPLVEE